MTDVASLDAASVPPLPAPGPLAQFFFDGLKERKLLILRCQACGHHVHYPRPICDRCQSTDLAPSPVSGQATLYAWTVVMQAFHPYFVDRIPYTLAVVELVEEPGLRLTTNIVDCAEEDLKLGMPLQVEFTEVAPDVILPMFRRA